VPSGIALLGFGPGLRLGMSAAASASAAATSAQASRRDAAALPPLLDLLGGPLAGFQTVLIADRGSGFFPPCKEHRDLPRIACIWHGLPVVRA
jgi:hypothetical protein